jgi:hypothetical protein
MSELQFDSWQGKEIFLFSQNAQAGLLYITQWEFIPQGVKLQNKADYSLPFSAKKRK